MHFLRSFAYASVGVVLISMVSALLVLPALLAPPALLTPATAARAQILGQPRATREPSVWLSAGVGYFEVADVQDGGSGSVWRFSGGVQYRAALEYSLGRGNTLGVSGTWAHLPLGYESGAGGCCVDAHANVSSLMAAFRAGGGTGLHTGLHYVFEVGAGAVRYADFTADRGGALEPRGGNTDFAFEIGTGLGYALAPAFQIVLVQDFGLAFHERAGLANNVRTTVQHRTTRVGVRYGM
jgi:hypothetical protein